MQEKVLEKNDISGPNKKNTDFRTVAISEGTKNFLDQISYHVRQTHET